MGMGGSAPRSGCFTPGKYPVPIVQEAEWAIGPVWTGAENVAPTGIRSPDRPPRIESIYRLSSPGRIPLNDAFKFLFFYHLLHFISIGGEHCHIRTAQQIDETLLAWMHTHYGL